MPEASKAHVPEPLMFLWVILKVISFLGIWLAIFLAMFLGYFTIPIIMIGILAIIYAFADIGTYVTNRRKQRLDEKQGSIQKAKDTGENSKDL